MREFNKLFNVFTVTAIIVMLLSTTAAACITVINRTNDNIFSADSYKNTEDFVSAL